MIQEGADRPKDQMTEGSLWQNSGKGACLPLQEEGNIQEVTGHGVMCSG